MNTANSNPYSASTVSGEQSRPNVTLSGLELSGIVVAAILASIYLVVVAASIYEILSAVGLVRIDSYLLEGTLAGLFTIICMATIQHLRRRRRRGRWLLLACPLLLLIWIYPGTFALLNFARRLTGL